MIRKFMPGWTADVISAEERLSRLSSEGVHLTGFSPVTSVFSFEEGEQKAYRYRICISRKCRGNVPKGLLSAGWERVCGTRDTYIIRHENADIEKVPDYRNNKTLNRLLFYISVVLLCYFVGFYIGYFASAIEDGALLEAISKIGFMINAALTVLAVVIMITFGRGGSRLRKTDADLGISNQALRTVPDENFIYSPKEEKAMLKAGTMMKKSPFVWYLEPDKTAEMVEKLALEGWKFYRFNKMGNTLYFIKSEPCRLKFVVDYQTITNDEYYLSAKDDGWKLEFTSITRITTFIIWTKEYEDEDDAPEFYTDTESVVSSAKQQLMSMTLPITILSICMVVLLVFMINEYREEHEAFPLIFSALYVVFLAEYGAMVVKSLGYYLRVRKKNKE